MVRILAAYQQRSMPPRYAVTGPGHRPRSNGRPRHARILALQVAGGRQQGFPPTAGSADERTAPITAQHLIGEYVSGCAKRPVGQDLGHLG
jgi:hypothetical protein